MSSFDLVLILSQDRPLVASETRILPLAGPHIPTQDVTATTYSRDNFIDLLRGLAILLALVFHALGTAFPAEHLQWGSGLFPDFNVSHSYLLLFPATFGWSGVAIFFAIIGFCIITATCANVTLAYALCD